MKLLVVASLVFAGCGGAALESIKVTNATDRAVEEVYVYPLGAKDHGASRGSIAPHATATYRLAKGQLEITAVSAKVQIDDRTRERRAASSAIELTKPVEVVLYDAAKPASVGAGVIGVAFTTDK